MKGTIEYGYVTVEGQVQNISGEKIENVEAVVNHYDRNGNFVTSDSTLVEYDPLMPGQTSPYRVGTRHNPEMKTFTVEFKRLMGEKLDVIDGTAEKKNPPKKPKK